MMLTLYSIKIYMFICTVCFKHCTMYTEPLSVCTATNLSACVGLSIFYAPSTVVQY